MKIKKSPDSYVVNTTHVQKRNQNIRDDILEMNHMNPSYTRQAQGEWENQQKRERELRQQNSS